MYVIFNLLKPLCRCGCPWRCQRDATSDVIVETSDQKLVLHADFIITLCQQNYCVLTPTAEQRKNIFYYHVNIIRLRILMEILNEN